MMARENISRDRIQLRIPDHADQRSGRILRTDLALDPALPAST